MRSLTHKCDLQGMPSQQKFYSSKHHSSTTVTGMLSDGPFCEYTSNKIASIVSSQRRWTQHQHPSPWWEQIFQHLFWASDNKMAPQTLCRSRLSALFFRFFFHLAGVQIMKQLWVMICWRTMNVFVVWRWCEEYSQVAHVSIINLIRYYGMLLIIPLLNSLVFLPRV